MAHPIVGVEIGSTGVKVALLDASLRGLEFKDAQLQEWPAPPSDQPLDSDATVPNIPLQALAAPKDDKASATLALHEMRAQTIDKALTKLAAPGAEFFLGFDGQKLSTRVLKFPMGDMKKIESVLEPELEDQLPRSLDEVSYSYAPLMLAKNQSELLVATAPRDELQAALTALAGVNKSPRAMLGEALALTALLPQLGGPDEQTAIIVDIGHTKTHILLASRGKPLFARTIREGGARLDRAIALAINVDQVTARNLKETGRMYLPHEQAEDEDDKAASEAMLLALKPLVISLRQTIHPYRSQLTGAKVYLTGGMALVQGIDRVLEAELGMGTQPLPLPPALAGRSDGHRYALAYALGVTGTLPPRHPRLDFRRGEFSFRGDLRQMSNNGRSIGFAVAAVVFLAFFSGITQCAVLRSDEKQLDETLKSVTKQMMGREMTDFKQALVAIRQSSSPEKAALPRYSALDFFGIISQRLDPSLDVRITELDLRPEKIVLKGETTGYDAAEKISELLQGHECFKQITQGKSKKSTDGQRVEFNIAIDLGCPQ